MVYYKFEKIFVIVFIILFIVFAPEFVFGFDFDYEGNTYSVQDPGTRISGTAYNKVDYVIYRKSNNPYEPISLCLWCADTSNYNNLICKVDNSYSVLPLTLYEQNDNDLTYITRSLDIYEFSNGKWTRTGTNGAINTKYIELSLSDAFISSSLPIYDNNNSLVYQPESSLVLPEIVTSSEKLQNLNFKNLEIDLHDYQGQDVYLLAYDKSSTTNIEDLEGNTIDYNSMLTDMVSDVLGLDNTSSEYGTAEDLVKLYPRKEILLNSDSKYYKGELVDGGSRYLIPIDELGLNFKINGTYAFKFAIREPIESDFSEWAYTYLGDYTSFTVVKNMSGLAVDEIEKQAEEKKRQQEREEDKQLQQEQTNAIRDQTAQDSEFYNNILSNDYDENTINNGLTGSTGGANDLDDSEYTGLFSAIFGKFSSIINGNFSSVEEIRYPIPNTNKEIVLRSDLLSSKIQGTFIYVFLQAFWLYLFGMYIFKFSNNLIRKIKSGSILNGYENNDEVITSTML